MAAILGTRLNIFGSRKLLPSRSDVSSALARWSTRLSRLAVAGAMAVAFLDRPPPSKTRDTGAAPPIEILRTKRVPMDGQKLPPKPSAGH